MTVANKKILLIDDEVELVDVYASSLRNAGYIVFIAENGLLGLDIARAEKPDLILLDLKMPKMSGMEVLEKMKEDPELKNIKVVFLTAFSDPLLPAFDVPFAQHKGALDLIKKGGSLEEFINKVSSHVGG